MALQIKMNGWAPRRLQAPAQTAPDEPVNETAKLLAALRDVNNRVGELRAAAAMLAAATRGCEANCSHAAVAADRGAQLVAMQARLDELQAANEGHDRRYDHTVGFVPEQRGHDFYLLIFFARGCKLTYETSAPIEPGAP